MYTEKKKDKLKFQSSAKAKDFMITEHFSGESNQKYLDWYIFSQEFTKVVLEKYYTDINKIRILKTIQKGKQIIW